MALSVRQLGHGVIVVLIVGIVLYVMNTKVAVVNIIGTLIADQRAQLHSLLDDQVHRRMWLLDLTQLRHDIEAIPWVDRATIRRVFPDQIVVKVQPHQPVARWKDGFINREGHYFTRAPEWAQSLVHFNGDDTARQEILNFYQQYAAPFAKANAKIDRISQDATYGWRLFIRDGIEVVLGFEQPMNRARTVLSAIRSGLLTRHLDTTYIDMRYEFGLALR